MLMLLFACLPDRALLSVPVFVEPVEAEVALEAVDVSLSAARLVLADLRLEAPVETARRWSLLSTAHAHPGHEGAGEVFGELVGEWSIDLLGEASWLGDGACYEGRYATARLSVAAVTLQGTATVSGALRDFSLVLSPQREITGIGFVEHVSAEAPPQRVTLSLDLQHGLSFIDWSVVDDDGDGTLTVSDGDLAETALFGVVSTPTYTLTLEN